MLTIAAGWFLKECPQTRIAVPAFRIGRTPVTIGQWNSYADAVNGPQAVPEPGPDHPVLVLWQQAADFCGWLGGVLGEEVRLPTEIEWERAARGDDGREYPWGDVFEADCANLAEAGLRATSPVGAFPKGVSPFGVLDLAGNADEWTGDVYAPYPGAPEGVPVVEDWAVDPHVTRGGGFAQRRDLARCARRHGVYPPYAYAAFRVAGGLA